MYNNEFIVKVKLLRKKVGCSKLSTYEHENFNMTVDLLVHLIYLDIDYLNEHYNVTNLNYIDAKYDDSCRTTTIVIKNYRLWDELL